MKVLNVLETALVGGGFLSLGGDYSVVSPPGYDNVLWTYGSIVAWLNSYSAGC